MSDIAARVADVQRRIGEACVRAGRDPGDVTLLAAAKTFGPEEVREAAEAGVRVVGENRVQEAAQKVALCPGRLRWHMIGHLQRNKARQAVGLFEMIHAVDSWRLLQVLDRAATEAGRVLPVLLEVNVSGESSKFGLPPGDVAGVLDKSAALTSLSVRGLMTLPPFTPNPEGARPFFRRLRELRDAWRGQTGFQLEDLSMGMSHDYEVAVEEGATWVRVGSGLFGERPVRKWRPQAGSEEDGMDG